MKSNYLTGILLLISAVCYPQTSHQITSSKGTTILVSVSKKTIAIAADSKIVNQRRESYGIAAVSISSMCKIRHIGNFFFAATGFVSASKIGAQEINVLDIIEAMDFDKIQTFDAKVNYIGANLQSQVQEIFYMLNLPPIDEPFLTVIFASFERKNPKIAYIKYFSKKKTVIDFSHFLTPISNAVSDNKSMFLSQNSENNLTPFLSEINSPKPHTNLNSSINFPSNSIEMIHDFNSSNISFIVPNSIATDFNPKDDKKSLFNSLAIDPASNFPIGNSSLSFTTNINIQNTIEDKTIAWKSIEINSNTNFGYISTQPNSIFSNFLSEVEVVKEDKKFDWTSPSKGLTESKYSDLFTEYSKLKKESDELWNARITPQNYFFVKDTVQLNPLKIIWTRPNDVSNKIFFKTYGSSRLEQYSLITTTLTDSEMITSTEFLSSVPHNFKFGETNAINEEFNSSGQGQALAVSKLVDLINKEINDPEGGKMVGAPIDIVVINAMDFKWLKKKQECD